MPDPRRGRVQSPAGDRRAALTLTETPKHHRTWRESARLDSTRQNTAAAHRSSLGYSSKQLALARSEQDLAQRFLDVELIGRGSRCRR